MSAFDKWAYDFTGGEGLEQFLHVLFLEGAVTDDDVACWLQEAFEAGCKEGEK